MLDELVDDSGLKPVAQRCIGGALRYTRYDYFKRIFMRMVAGQRGQATDASKDVEYSDWPDVEAFVDEFLVAAGISLAATASPS
jgi:menaquinone-dependent protoporphyrinogen oxidase